MMRVMPIHTTPKGSKEALHAMRTRGVINDTKNALVQRFAKTPGALDRIRLRRPNQDERGRLLKPTQQLKHAGAAGHGARSTFARRGLRGRRHGNRQIDHCDVNNDRTNEAGNFVRRSCDEAINAARRKKWREQRRKRVIPPTPVTQEEIQPTRRRLPCERGRGRIGNWGEGRAHSVIFGGGTLRQLPCLSARPTDTLSIV